MSESLVRSLARRCRPVLAAAATLLAAGCSYSPDVPSGAIHCSSDGRCPGSFVCGGDQVCYAASEQPPDAPTGVSAVGGAGAISVTWTAPARAGASAITRYTVAGTSTGAGAPLAANATTTSTTFSGLAPGAGYVFTVVAVNAKGASPASAPSAAVSTFDVPGAPGAPVATAKDRGASLDWTAPASTGGAPITGYAVVQSLGGAAYATSTAAFTGAHAEVSGLQPAGAYTFEVRALNAAGSGALSAASNAVTLPGVPPAPAITAAPSASQGDAGLTASVAAVTGFTYTWSATGATITSSPAGDTAGGLNTVTYSVTASAGGKVVLSCAATNASGTGPAGSATQSVLAAPGAPAITVAPLLLTGAAATASVPATAGMTYEWVVTAGGLLTSSASGTTAGQTNTVAFNVTAAAGSSVALQVTEVNALGKRGAPSTRTTAVGALPAQPVITAPDLVTAGATGLVASIPAVLAGETIAWTVTGGGAPVGAANGQSITFSATGAAGSAVHLSAVVSNTLGAGPAGTRDALVVAAPVAPAVAADAAVTQGAAGRTASVPMRAGFTYQWTITGGTITQTAADTASVTYSVPAGAAPGSLVALSAKEKNAAGDLSSAGTASVPVRAVLAVSSVVPAALQAGVALDAVPVATLSRAAGNPSVTATSACGQSTLRLQVVGQSACLPLTLAVNGSALSLDPGGLLPGTQYQLTAVGGAGGLADDQGVPLAQSAVTTFTTHAELAPTPLGRLQSALLSWSEPAAPSYAGAQLEYKLHSAGTYTVANPGAPVRSPATLPGLAPGGFYDVRVRAKDGAVLSPGAPVSVQLAPSGSPQDFLSASSTPAGTQTAAGPNGARFALTWSADTLYPGVAGSDPAKAGLVTAADALWLAIDVDGAGADAAGELRTVTGASASSTDAVLWPFKADYIVELRWTGAALATRLRTGGVWTSLDAAPGVFTARATLGGAQPGFDEVAVPLSALPGLPAAPSFRFAFALVNAPASGRGNTLDLAPAGAGQSRDVTGTAGSLSSGWATGANAFAPGQAQSALAAGTSPVTPAAWLVGLRVSDGSGTEVVSSREPFSAGNSFFGSTAANYNLGAATGELAFRLGDGATTELDASRQRVWTLSGGADVLPVLTVGQPYGASHPATITFTCTAGCAGAVELLGSVAELGDLTPGNGVPLCGGAACAADSVSVTVVMTHPYDFNTTPLLFQVAGAGLACSSGGLECGAIHVMGGDLLDARTLRFVAGDGSGF